MAASKGKGLGDSAPPAYAASNPGYNHHQNAVIAAADIRARDEVHIDHLYYILSPPLQLAVLDIRIR